MRADFGAYASKCLKIRTKAGEIEPFNLNRAQQHLHGRAEAQLERTGRVRLIVLKGRQQGISTYIEGRFYWRVTHRKGCRAFILTHEQEATDNLFGMAVRYHENCNPLLKPSTGAANAKELHFDRLDSGYKVGTAGTKGVGRSQTLQYFHGSEAAFWPFAETHAAGVMQAIPDAGGTEVFLESTANGVGNYFHSMWQQAESKQGDFESVFIPWFWQPEYARDADGLIYDEDEAHYAEEHGLTREQMAWRRAKIQSFKGDLSMFRQEYPATALEAFQSSEGQSFIQAELVSRARKSEAQPIGPKILGVDVARFGDDRTVLTIRQGRVVKPQRVYEHKDLMEVAGLVKRCIDEESPDRVFIDVIGVGAGVVDRLKEMGYAVVGASSSNKPLDDTRYVNRRAEMFGELRDWLADVPAVLPSDDALQSDLCALTYKFDSKGRYQLERKEDAKKRGVRSPDMADSLALTFYEPVAPAYEPETRVYGPGGWMS